VARALAEVLFCLGHLETVLAAMLVTHAVLLWRWRRRPAAAWLALGWLALFLAVSATLLADAVVRPTIDRLGDDTARLAGTASGAWRTDGEALAGVVERWTHAWLPVYLPWCGAWLAGLAGTVALTRRRQRRPAGGDRLAAAPLP